MIVRENSQPFLALAIAGSDSFAGAGIAADVRTFHSHGIHCFTAITAVTSQNTGVVKGVHHLNGQDVFSQIEAVMDDDRPMGVKIGMVGSAEVIDIIFKSINYYGFNNVVLDPIIMTHSGKTLLETSLVNKLKNELIPLVDVLTPNINEAEELTGISINNIRDAKDAASKVREMGVENIFLKGGHAPYGAIDILLSDDNFYDFEAETIDTLAVHGTGCTLSSAIVANLIKGESVVDSCQKAKNYVRNSISRSLSIGRFQRIARQTTVDND